MGTAMKENKSKKRGDVKKIRPSPGKKRLEEEKAKNSLRDEEDEKREKKKRTNLAEQNGEANQSKDAREDDMEVGGNLFLGTHLHLSGYPS